MISEAKYQKAKVSEVADILGGGTPKTSISEYWGGDIPWLSVVDFNNGFRKVDRTEKYITKLGLKNCSSNILEPGQIIISARGTVGALAQVARQMAFNQSCYGLKVKSGVSDDYLYYALKNIVKEIQANTHGSVFDTITRKTFDELTIPIPPHAIQVSIAELLSVIDDKIELNNKINKTLEEMAQAIFKSWFVDFEPFKEGEFIESEYGNIPKNWKIMKLGDVCKIQKGLSYKGQHLKDTGIPMINLGCVEPGGDFRLSKMKYYDGEYKTQHTVTSGDIIIANTDMTSDRLILGSPIIVPEFNSQTIIFTHHLFAFNNLKISREYIYYFLKSETFRKRAEGYANGTTVLSLSKEDVLSIDLLVPDNQTLEKFTGIVGKLIKQKQNNDNENLKLEKIRDSLLPKLMSGEIRVPLEEATYAEVR